MTTGGITTPERVPVPFHYNHDGGSHAQELNAV
jgi:hypothetical protein